MKSLLLLGNKFPEIGLPQSFYINHIFVVFRSPPLSFLLSHSYFLYILFQLNPDNWYKL